MKKSPIHQSLWFWVVLAFLALIASWAVMVTLAVKYGPQPIETETPPGK